MKSEKYFFADPDTPFHVWVRERHEGRGYRWVLRDASEVIGVSHRSDARTGIVLHSSARGSDTLR